MCDHPLKGILAKRYFNHDGSLNGKITLNGENIEFILGLCYANVPNANLILAALNEYGSVDIVIDE